MSSYISLKSIEILTICSGWFQHSFKKTILASPRLRLVTVMLPRPPNPLERCVVAAALIAMCLAPIEVHGSNITSVQPRDPVSFQPDAFSALLNELSYSPDSRVSIHSGRLSYIESYKHSTRARWYRPNLRSPALPFQSPTKSAAP